MYIGDDIAIASDNTCGETTTLHTNFESVGSALQATPPFSFRESLAPIPFSIVRNIQALEYVDFVELLPGNREFLQRLEATENKGSDTTWTTSCRKLILSNHLGPVIYGLCSNSAAKTPLTYTRATGVQ